jgi:N-acyl-D-amino-acid deacylase
LPAGARRPAHPPQADEATIRLVPDIIVSDGQLIDGTGSPRQRADVAISGDRVVAVGDLSGVRARRRVDAAGRVVTPGFIDLLGHSYYALLLDPAGTSKLLQGVTLEVTGERLGAGPLHGLARDLCVAEGLKPLGLDACWDDHAGYEALIQQQGIALNIACTIPGALLRASVTDPWSGSPLTGRQFDCLCELLKQAFAQGAVSVTFVLEEAPCCFYARAELDRLLEIARDHDRLVMFHLRDEGAGVLAALDEVIGMLRRTGARGEVLHLKVLGAANWHLITAVIDRLERAQAEGIDLQANAYPYTAAGLALQQLIPGLVRHDPAQLAARLRRSPARRRALLDDLTNHHPARLWEGVRMATVPPGEMAWPFSDLADHAGTTPAALAVDLLTEAHDWIHLSVEAIADDCLDLLYARPWVGVVSDGSARHPQIKALAQGPAHPREYGTFPRFLREFVRTRGVLDEAAAVSRITSRAAGRLGLHDRGRVVPGAAADLLVFDPGQFRDRATIDQPNRLAEGLDWVIVNGQIVVQHGAVTGTLPGTVVHPPTGGAGQ